MPQFHETGTGSQFFVVTLPRFAKAVESIAKSLAAIVQQRASGLSLKELRMVREALTHYVDDGTPLSEHDEFRTLERRVRSLVEEADQNGGIE